MKTSLRCFCEEERRFCQESHQKWMDLLLSRYEKCFFLCETCANLCYGLHKAQALSKRSFVANFMAPCSGLIQVTGSFYLTFGASFHVIFI